MCRVTVTESGHCFITSPPRLLMLLMMMMMMMMLMSVGCRADPHDQQASRMMVFRDLPDGVEPNHPQHLIIRTAYEVAHLSELSLLSSVVLLF